MEKRKKTGILTHPLHTNYGGLLQAYALQEALRRMGHDVRTVDLRLASKNKLKELLKPVLLPILNLFFPKKFPSKGHKEMLRRRHTERFIRDNIRTTVPVRGSAEAGLLEPYRFDVWIVGSDQCWRAAYIPDPWMHFLGFVPENSAAKRIAYAVSMGTDTWEYDPARTAMCASLAKKFDAISVRESSGVALCREHLGVEATHLIDPTLLLSAEDYLKLADEDNMVPDSPAVVSYILDPSQEKETIVGAVTAHIGIPVRELTVSFEHSDPVFRQKYAGTYLPVTQWLRSFADARFVVTDSFHGAVFSIISRKPFIVIGNKSRGMTRFTSLLSMFGLEDRLVEPNVTITPEMIDRPIDWDRVGVILEQERGKSAEFLKNVMES
jgi:hypothetical protein